MAKEADLDLLVARERARDKHYEKASWKADLFVARSVADLDVLYKQYEEHRHRLVGELLISIMNNINIDMAMRHRLVDELLLLPAGASVGPSTAGRSSLRLLGVRSLYNHGHTTMATQSARYHHLEARSRSRSPREPAQKGKGKAKDGQGKGNDNDVRRPNDNDVRRLIMGTDAEGQGNDLTSLPPAGAQDLSAKDDT